MTKDVSIHLFHVQYWSICGYQYQSHTFFFFSNMLRAAVTKVSVSFYRMSCKAENLGLGIEPYGLSLIFPMFNSEILTNLDRYQSWVSDPASLFMTVKTWVN